MYKLTREFHFEYAHRLNMDYESPCRNIHGHSARVIISIKGSDVDKNGMIVDFSKLRPLQIYLEDKFDHSLILNSQDNIARMIEGLVDLHQTKKFKDKVINDLIALSANIFMNQKLCFINGDPTSENLSRIIWEISVEMLQSLGIPWEHMEITFYETAKNCASFEGINPTMIKESVLH